MTERVVVTWGGDIQDPQTAARGPQGRERVRFLGRAARFWEGTASPLHTTHRNLREHCKVSSLSGVQGGAPAQIDVYALLGLEMVTDSDNSD